MPAAGRCCQPRGPELPRHTRLLPSRGGQNGDARVLHTIQFSGVDEHSGVNEPQLGEQVEAAQGGRVSRGGRERWVGWRTVEGAREARAVLLWLSPTRRCRPSVLHPARQPYMLRTHASLAPTCQRGSAGRTSAGSRSPAPTPLAASTRCPPGTGGAGWADACRARRQQDPRQAPVLPVTPTPLSVPQQPLTMLYRISRSCGKPAGTQGRQKGVTHKAKQNAALLFRACAARGALCTAATHRTRS